MRATLRILLVSVVSVLLCSGICLADIQSGGYVMRYSGVECREVHHDVVEGSVGSYSNEGQGYMGNWDSRERATVTCPIWYMEQLDVGRYRWSWAPGYGLSATVWVRAINNNPFEPVRCRVKFSDSLDWNGDAWADYGETSLQSSYGMGAGTLEWNLEEYGWTSRDQFLSVECVLPYAHNTEEDWVSKIAGYRFRITKTQTAAE